MLPIKKPGDDGFDPPPSNPTVTPSVTPTAPVVKKKKNWPVIAVFVAIAIAAFFLFTR